MTEIFPKDNIRALTWNGRRAFIVQSLTAVAHLYITIVSPILLPSLQTRGINLVKMLLMIHEQV